MLSCVCGAGGKRCDSLGKHIPLTLSLCSINYANTKVSRLQDLQDRYYMKRMLEELVHFIGQSHIRKKVMKNEDNCRL